jgi:hypothetical protein
VAGECRGVERFEREAVPRETRDGGCRDGGCADAVDASMGEAEFIARVEEAAAPEYVRAADPEAGGGPPLSSAGREVQQPYRKSIVHQLSWERRPMKQSGQSSTVKSGADVQTLQKKGAHHGS